MTLNHAMKHINEGENVETVKKAICDGTPVELTNALTKQIVQYFQSNKERTQTGKLPAHVLPTFTVSADVE